MESFFLKASSERILLSTYQIKAISIVETVDYLENIITTNLPFDRWDEIFRDQILTTAIIDRVAYKSHIIDLSGESFRGQETLKWINSKYWAIFKPIEWRCRQFLGLKIVILN